MKPVFVTVFTRVTRNRLYRGEEGVPRRLSLVVPPPDERTRNHAAHRSPYRDAAAVARVPCRETPPPPTVVAVESARDDPRSTHRPRRVATRALDKTTTAESLSFPVSLRFDRPPPPRRGAESLPDRSDDDAGHDDDL